MSTTKTKITTAAALDEMRAELATLDQQITTADDELQGIAFMAERGERDAQRRRSELMGVRAAAEHRARELRDAIASGEKYAVAEQRAAEQAERDRWARKADELRDQQLAAARRLDAALAEADAAWAAYVAATDERGAATRRAGRPWSNVAWVNSFLPRLLFKQAPTLARLVRQDPEFRKHAATAEDMVRQ